MVWCVDYFLYIGFYQKEDIDALNIIYQLKECFGTSDWYLGANVEKLKLEYGQALWYTNCVDYLKITIESVNNFLGDNKTALKNDG